MNETFLIRDVLADPSHEVHSAAKDIMEKLDSGEISLCGCLGPMYGEPYCYCQMKQKGLEAEMENNRDSGTNEVRHPLRIAEDERWEAQMKVAREPGGWLYKIRKGNV